MRDLESLERENDRNLETMGDRVSMLKNITMDIHKEADAHHRILDGMRDDMSGFQGVLTQTVAHFSKVLETKNGRYFCYLFGFFIGMWLLSKIIFAWFSPTNDKERRLTSGGGGARMRERERRQHIYEQSATCVVVL